MTDAGLAQRGARRWVRRNRATAGPGSALFSAASPVPSTGPNGARHHVPNE